MQDSGLSLTFALNLLYHQDDSEQPRADDTLTRVVSVRRLVISPDFRNFLTFKRLPNVVADLSAAADRKDYVALSVFEIVNI